MKLRGCPNASRFFAGLIILSVTFTQVMAAVQGCLVFGWRSCLQTMNAMTNPNKARAAAGRSPASSFIGFPPFSASQSSGVIQVPADAKTSMTTTVARNSFQLPRPVTHWPISASEIRNSADRPKIEATYLRFASLSFTTQAYHTFPWRATQK